MILSFSDTFPWGGSTMFETQIDLGIKKHTFRIGNRWQPGDIIHFWMGSPRNPGKSHPFQPGGAFLWVPYNGREMPIVVATEEFKMHFVTDTINSKSSRKPEYQEVQFFLDIGQKTKVCATFVASKNGYGILRQETDGQLLKKIARNDGFKDEPIDFIRWFYSLAQKKELTEIKGQIIHWYGTCIAYDKTCQQELDHIGKQKFI
jgi:hypothetical protein